MTKKRDDSVIDYFSDKTLSFGCVVYSKENNEEYIVGDNCYLCDKKKKHGGKILRLGRSYLSQSYKNMEVKIDNLEILGHPIMIGNVIFKKDNSFWLSDHNDSSISNLEYLHECWNPLGNKSLQDIRKESGYEKINCHCGIEKIPQQRCNQCIPTAKLKDPNAEALFTFLREII